MREITITQNGESLPSSKEKLVFIQKKNYLVNYVHLREVYIVLKCSMGPSEIKIYRKERFECARKHRKKLENLFAERYIRRNEDIFVPRTITQIYGLWIIVQLN